jgi:Flp pilus assembly protein TadD
MGAVDEALETHRQAVRLDPTDASTHTNLGAALYDKGELDEALAAHRHSLCLAPTDPIAHGALGQALLREGKFAEAKATTRRCLDLLAADHPTTSSSPNNAGRAGACPPAPASPRLAARPPEGPGREG